MRAVRSFHILFAVLGAAALARAQQPSLHVPLHVNEAVTVTAYGTPLAADHSATSTIILTPEQLQQSPSRTFGDTLRDLPGIEFYRRTGTLIANPTSQGISLRGLGSTSSSRTLVLSDHIPLNDAFGGWVHWEEFPILTVNSVEVVRGGASDLYGSAAVGGVVNILRTEPDQTSFSLLASDGSQNTANVSALASWIHNQWSAAAAAGILRTDGYIVVAPWQRGPIDTAYNAHIANSSLFLARTLSSQKLFARANAYNDNRDNGTPSRPTPTASGATPSATTSHSPHAQHITARLYGSDNHYRQASPRSTPRAPAKPSPVCCTHPRRSPAPSANTLPSCTTISASSPAQTSTTSAAPISRSPSPPAAQRRIRCQLPPARHRTLRRSALQPQPLDALRRRPHRPLQQPRHPREQHRHADHVPQPHRDRRQPAPRRRLPGCK